MGDYWVDMALSILFAFLKGLVKNKKKKGSYPTQTLMVGNVRCYFFSFY